RKKKGGSASSTTPPTPIATPTLTSTIVAASRLTAAAKGKQPARATNEAKKVNNDDDNEEEISKIDEQEATESDESDDEATESNRESEDEEKREQEEESFDPIPRTPKDSEDDENNEEDQGLRIGEEERMHEEEGADELYRDVNINQGRGLQVSQETEGSHAQVTRILPRIEESVNAKLEAEVLTRSSHSSRTSYAVEADLSEMDLKKILIEKMEGNKSMQRSDEQQNLYKALVEAYDAENTILDTYGESAILKRRREDDDQEGPSAGSDRGSKRQREGGEHASASTPSEPTTGSAGRLPVRWRNPHIRCLRQNKSLPADQGNAQSWISTLAKQTDARSSFNELLDTPIDFSNFIMNRLGVDTLTPELLAGPTYELMRGSCNSLTELKYHLEEVYKAMTDPLDWVNPEGQQYPHNLLQPLPLIPDNQGRRIQEPINYDKHALWGVSHWGRKCQQFYGFAVNRESALDVYSKRRIIAVTDLKLVEWYNYKHLDWISVRHDDDKIYKFKEGDFKRLRLQDIEDMLLLLVQGKLSKLTVEERFAFNVSLRMFMRSIVIQRPVKDLQLGAAPKPKASARNKKGGSASSTPPPTPIATPTPTTTVVAAPRLSAAAKDVDEQTKGKEESEGDKTDESYDGNDDDNDETVKTGSERDEDDDDEELEKNDDEDTKSGKDGDEVSETPKPKASARKKTSGSASSTTPPTPIATLTPTTTVVSAPRLSATAKGKQPTRATTPSEPTDVERTEAKQLKIVLKQSRQETHISQQRGSGTDEGTSSRPGVPDVPSDDSEEELSWNSSDDEDVD
nr:hypothetical protein [Tanacetum cinerariifolium]